MQSYPIVCYSVPPALTRDGQFQLEPRLSGHVADLESIGGHEGFVDVAEDVDLEILVVLFLPPENRVLEEVVLVGVEVALEHRRLTLTENVELTFGNHRQEISCNTSRNRYNAFG